MPKKYRRYCNQCDEYYEGWGEKFCSSKCANLGNRDKSLPKIIKQNKKRIRPAEERFWEKVKIGEEDECWEWQATRNGIKNYGNFINDLIKSNLAHRVAYYLANGDFDESLNVCHKCDNPPCVNPNHLFLGTQKENLQDMLLKNRFPTGQNHWKSKITNEEREQILNLLSKGMKIKEIAKKLNIPTTTISNIKYRSFLDENMGN
jgi:hypothetical protein